MVRSSLLLFQPTMSCCSSFASSCAVVPGDKGGAEATLLTLILSPKQWPTAGGGAGPDAEEAASAADAQLLLSWARHLVDVPMYLSIGNNCSVRLQD